MEHPHILVFDSGVGGLSIMQAIQDRFPHCYFSYASDNAMFPYGTKDEEVLITRVDQVLHQLHDLAPADIIVIACNTASTVTLPSIRKRFDMPVVGVVPAIKPAAKISLTKTIGLLATPGTISRTYTKNLIQEFAQDCEVICVGSSKLVEIAEQKLRGETLHAQDIESIVEPFKIDKLDTVVLACTHFPLLRAELQKALPNINNWIDSGDAIARRVGHWLEQKNLPQSGPVCQNHTAFFTAQTEQVQRLTPALLKRHLSNITFIQC